MANSTATTVGFATPSHTQHLEDILPSLVELFDPTSHNMCEFGDIVLVIEDGYHPQLKIKVNSCILTSTSKVFRTLFHGCFAEGEAIRAGTREIFMNDKPAPMLALCQLLHLKPVEPAVDERNVLEFALLVDKFDCVQALKLATDSMLSQFGSSYSYESIVSAFILEQPKHFRSFTKSLILRSYDLRPAGMDSDYPDLVREHLPGAFTTSISYQQNLVRKELVNCITSMLDLFATSSYGMDRPHLVHDLMATMRSSGLWPIWPAGSRTQPLQEQLAAFSSIEVPIISTDLKDAYMSPWSSAAPTLTSRSVIRLSERLSDLCDGLCLYCLKGRNRCTWGHADAWGSYEDERWSVFRRRGQSSRGTRSVSPVSENWDEGGWGIY